VAKKKGVYKGPQKQVTDRQKQVTDRTITYEL
jgi:hypothetical protein